MMQLFIFQKLNLTVGEQKKNNVILHTASTL